MSRGPVRRLPSLRVGERPASIDVPDGTTDDSSSSALSTSSDWVSCEAKALPEVEKEKVEERR